MLKNVAFMSIKKDPINKILKKEKLYEFRNIKPNRDINFIIVYIPTPIKEMKYILEVDKYIERNNITINKLNKVDNIFDSSNKYKLAYPIKHLYALNKPLKLEILKNNFNFYAPQSFAYGDKYFKLLQEIEEEGYKIIY